MNVKDNARNADTWIRGLFIIVFAVIFYVLYIVIWLLVIFQFFTKVLTGKLNDNLSSFSESLTHFAFQILRYITFQSEERPFPFSPWPQGDGSTDAVLPEPATTESGQTTETPEKKSDDSTSG